MGSSGLGRVGPEPSAIRPKTGEVLYAPTAGFSVFRTGSRRHFEPLFWRRPILKTYFEAVKDRFRKAEFPGFRVHKIHRRLRGRGKSNRKQRRWQIQRETKTKGSLPAWGCVSLFFDTMLTLGERQEHIGSYTHSQDYS
jgi:hypothetical protein